MPLRAALCLTLGISLAGMAVADPQRAPEASRNAVVVDPIVVPECRLAVIDKQEVPSQRDGVLWAVCTEIKPDEIVPPDRLLVVRTGEQERRYRRLKEGDPVEAGQLVALLDDRLARDDWAIKKGQVLLSEADLAATERARDEARDRYLTQMKLRSSAGGPATSEEDLAGAKLLWYRNYCEALSKKEAVALARLVEHQAQTVLGMYEVRSTIAGVIKRIHKQPGEAVKSLEPVVEVRSLARLRAEGLVDVQHLPRLAGGMKAVVQPAQVQGPQLTLNGHLQEINGLAVSRDPNNPLIVSAGEDGTVRVWTRSSRRAQRVLTHPAPVKAVACTPPGAAGNLCLTGSADGVARLWDLDGRSELPLRELKGQHHGPVTGVAFSPNGKACVTGGEDHEICMWETESGTLRGRFPAGHLGAVTALSFPTPARVVSAGRDNTVRVWAVDGQGVWLENTLGHRSGDVSQLGVSADGQRLLFDQGNTLHLLALPRGTSEGILRNLSGGAPFTGVALFSPDGRLVLTAGTFEGRLQLWRTPADAGLGAELRQLVPPDRSPATCAAFAPNGKFLVTGTRNRQVLVWPLPAPEDITQQLPGEVTLVEQAVESSARQVRVWAELPNPGGRLVPGTTVTMTIYPPE